MNMLYKNAKPLLSTENEVTFECSTLPFYVVNSLIGYQVQIDGMWVDINAIDCNKYKNLVFLNVRKPLCKDE